MCFFNELDQGDAHGAMFLNLPEDFDLYELQELSSDFPSKRLFSSSEPSLFAPNEYGLFDDLEPMQKRSKPVFPSNVQFSFPSSPCQFGSPLDVSPSPTNNSPMSQSSWETAVPANSARNKFEEYQQEEDDSSTLHVSAENDFSAVPRAPRKEHEKTTASTDAQKRRFVWSSELHDIFVEAVNTLDPDFIGPKSILRVMTRMRPDLCEELCTSHVKSHLQKWRKRRNGGFDANDSDSSRQNSSFPECSFPSNEKFMDSFMDVESSIRPVNPPVSVKVAHIVPPNSLEIASNPSQKVSPPVPLVREKPLVEEKYSSSSSSSSSRFSSSSSCSSNSSAISHDLSQILDDSSLNSLLSDFSREGAGLENAVEKILRGSVSEPIDWLNLGFLIGYKRATLSADSDVQSSRSVSSATPFPPRNVPSSPLGLDSVSPMMYSSMYSISGNILDLCFN